jgi:hypothetical protein
MTRHAGRWLVRCWRAAARAGLAGVWVLATVVVVSSGRVAHADETAPSLRIATFDADATPPVGLRMAYDNVIRPASRCGAAAS